MKYCSTRGKVSGLSFREALFSGYTSDGGLCVPESIPKLESQTINDWIQAKLTYPQVVEKVARLFISKDEISDAALKNCIDQTYCNFAIKEILGLKECIAESGRQFKVAELYHGPTGSFKDYAMCLVGRLIEHFLKQRKENTIILVSTSGDTGSAAIKAVEGLEGVDIIVLYPDGNITPVQELQMNSSIADNVHVFAAEGTSDDLDVPIKQCFPGNGIMSINSINWARIMIQIAHFVYLYIHEGTELDIFVPTGGGGNVSAGLLASLMGIPIKFYLSTNENDNVYEFLKNGKLQMGGPVITTPANAMDIRYPCNLERIIYFISKSAETTEEYMRLCETSTDTVVTVENKIMESIREIIPKCHRSTSDEILGTIKKTWLLNKYMVCPHTATGVAHVSNHHSARKAIVISTASPQKFPEAIYSCGISAVEWDGNELRRVLENGPQRKPIRSMTKGKDFYKILHDKISSIRSLRALNN